MPYELASEAIRRGHRFQTDVPEGYDHRTVVATADETLITEAGRRLAKVAPDADIIVFGSRARGEAHPDSDLDLLVIEPEFRLRGKEYVRLRKELRGLDVAVDLLVYRRSEAEKWREVPGTFLYDVLREGRVLVRA